MVGWFFRLASNLQFSYLSCFFSTWDSRECTIACSQLSFHFFSGSDRIFSCGMSPAQMLSDTGLHSVQQELKVFFLPLPCLNVFNVLSLAFLLEALWFLGLLLIYPLHHYQTALYTVFFGPLLQLSRI